MGGEKKSIQGYGGGNLRGKIPLRRPRLEGTIILKWMFNKELRDVETIEVD
jgi:hypothetical protein